MAKKIDREIVDYRVKPTTSNGAAGSAPADAGPDAAAQEAPQEAPGAGVNGVAEAGAGAAGSAEGADGAARAGDGAAGSPVGPAPGTPQVNADNTSASGPGADAEQDIISMHEALERPYELVGCTYKIKPPVSDHALYITINDIVLNQGTSHEVRRPFEIFINSKNLDHFQWIVALTRIVSAVFRKGGDVAFLVEELKAVFDPKGGYWKPGGKFMPSLIAEIGDVIEHHLTKIGMLQPRSLNEHQKAILAQKRAEYEAAVAQPDLFAEDLTRGGAEPGTGAASGGSAAAGTGSGARAGGITAGASGRSGASGVEPGDVDRAGGSDSSSGAGDAGRGADSLAGGGAPAASTGASDGGGASAGSPAGGASSPFPAGAQLCTKCNTAAVVLLDGCRTCLSCGDSKCG